MGTQPAHRFAVTEEKVDGALLLACRGRLTAEVTEGFKRELKSRFAQGKRIILEMNGVTAMDSSGLGAVVSLWVSAKSAGCQLQFYNLSEPVKRLFGLTHVLKAFESCGSHLTKMP